MKLKISILIIAALTLMGIGASDIYAASQARRTTTTTKRTAPRKTTKGTGASASRKATPASPMAALAKALSQKSISINSVATLDKELLWAKGFEDKFGNSIKSGVKQRPDGKFAFDGSLRALDKTERYYDAVEKLRDYIGNSKQYNATSMQMIEGMGIQNTYMEFLILQHINDLLERMPSEDCKEAFKGDMVSMFKTIRSYADVCNTLIVSGGTMDREISVGRYNDITSAANDFMYQLSENLDDKGLTAHSTPDKALSKLLSIMVCPSENDNPFVDKSEFNKAKEQFSNTANEFIANYSKWLASYPGHNKKADTTAASLIEQWQKDLKEELTDCGVDVNALLKKAEEADRVYTTADQEPEFIGGQAAMYKWLAENIKYPEEAGSASGRIMVEFVIDKTGSVSNAKIVLGKHPVLDAEALRVVKSMPKWNPGRINGTPVAVKQTVTLSFRP